MYIKEIVMRKVNMRMKHPFTTSFGTQQDRSFIIVEAINDKDVSGWGECVSTGSPLYIEEFTDSAWLMLKDHLIPLVLNKEITHPDELQETFQVFKRNNLAKSAIEGAIWDLYAKEQNKSLAECLGGVHNTIEVGVSLGIEENTDDLLRSIKEKVQEGYKRIKVKIRPGKDLDVLETIRDTFPDIPLMVDANSAYSLEDIDIFKKMEKYHLMMIEQPLAAGDLIDHAKLQKEIDTPICLDESIHSLENVRQAIEIGSCKIINLKVGRVGGLTESKKIHDLCKQHDIPLWCGGMLESGVGRAHNIAVTSLANFTLPGDTASSSKYWNKDIIEPEVIVQDGKLDVPKGAGIGYDINREELDKHTVENLVFK